MIRCGKTSHGFTGSACIDEDRQQIRIAQGRGAVGQQPFPGTVRFGHLLDTVNSGSTPIWTRSTKSQTSTVRALYRLQTEAPGMGLLHIVRECRFHAGPVILLTVDTVVFPELDQPIRSRGQRPDPPVTERRKRGSRQIVSTQSPT